MKENVIAYHNSDIVLEDHPHVSKNSGNKTYEQYLLEDDDTGMLIKMVRYPKGSVNAAARSFMRARHVRPQGNAAYGCRRF